MYTNYTLVEIAFKGDNKHPQIRVCKVSSQSFTRMKEQIDMNIDSMSKDGWEIVENKTRDGKVADFPIGECCTFARLKRGSENAIFRLYKTQVK